MDASPAASSARDVLSFGQDEARHARGSMLGGGTALVDDGERSLGVVDPGIGNERGLGAAAASPISRFLPRHYSLWPCLEELVPATAFPKSCFC
uniref:Uncharacterized protein n=2 Tax=Oryza TaxID=4527 RepID=A0A679BAB4_ORYNI|nr:hypothetical protein [Oryza sativa Indica Group]BBF89849.1 hypothetical protein [Oryza sativa f. spontanea]BBF89860.1 hypothetical protein [Oryza sativa f. spontanea]